MKNLIALILFFTFFFSSSFPQDGIPGYIENYPGIPLLAATNCFAYTLDNSRLAKLKELGIYGIVAADLHAGDLERIRSFGLKIFPYFIWSEYRSALVTNYTDAYYTLWEAEGKGDGSNGDVELKHSALGELFTEGGVSGIKTINSTPGKLIYGPAYLQEPRYRLIQLEDTSVIKYRADYRLKVKLNGNPLPWDYMDHVVCTLKVVSLDGYYPTPAEKELYTREVHLSDFPGWDTWDTLSISDYTLDILENLTDQEYIERMTSAEHDTTFSVSHMEYQVVWSGLSYLDLYVDNIEVSDPKGRNLVYDPNIRNAIYNYIHNTHAELNDTSITIGWFGSNEPMTIDSYEPFRIVNEIVRQATNDQLRLYTGFTSGWLGWFGGPWPDNVPNGNVFKTSEFMKRTKLPIVHYNAHMYNVPYSLPLYPDYIKLNIEEVVDRNLKKINDLQIPFSYETQSGKFYKLDSLCFDETAFYIVPTPEQMLYHINLGLMSGVRDLLSGKFNKNFHQISLAINLEF